MALLFLTTVMTSTSVMGLFSSSWSALGHQKQNKKVSKGFPSLLEEVSRVHRVETTEGIGEWPLLVLLMEAVPPGEQSLRFHPVFLITASQFSVCLSICTYLQTLKYLFSYERTVKQVAPFYHLSVNLLCWG